MIVSSKGRYALRVMVALARRENETLVPLKELAQEEDISQKYLEAIMTSLSKGGMVEGVHGKHGGYRLNRPVEEYSVGSILRLTEGDLKAVGCNGDCGNAARCFTRPMWNRLNTMVDQFFDGITLADLMKEA